MPEVEKVTGLDRVRNIVAEVLEVEIESVAADASFYDDLAVDSLEKVEIIVRAGREFDVELSPDEAAAVTSSASLAALLRTKSSAGLAAPSRTERTAD